MLKSGVYLCTSGHVVPAPSMGMYLACQHPVSIEAHGVRTRRSMGIGMVPCGAGIVELSDPEGTFAAAYRLGGTEAVLAVIEERRREGAEGAASGG